MTTVNTVEDIIEALDANPILLEALRARLLTRELLELPQVVAQLAAAQAEMRKDMDRFAAEQATMRKDMDRFAAEQAEMRKDIDRLSVSQAKTAADVAVLQDDVSVLKDDVASLKGDHLEMRLQGKVHAMLGQRKSLRGIRVVCAAFPAGMAPEFVDAIDDAADEDKITEGQRGRILSTDLIATARRRRSRQPIYVSFEVAHSLDEDDARRVVETGDALARVFPQAEVMSFIYGQSISERDRTQAEAQGVEVVVERAAR